MRRKTPEDYHKLAESKGFKWLGPEVSNTHTKTQWKCSNGHVWSVPYGRIGNGHGCPICYGNAPRTADDYSELAEKRNFNWVGQSLPPNTRIKTKWQCSKNHRWMACYRDIQQGTGCPYCAHKAPKTLRDYLDLAEKSGIKLLSPEIPRHTKIKVEWQCELGHCWMTSYHSIQQGTNCPHCAGKARITVDDYLALAAQKGIKWIESEIPKANDKTIWECSEGHLWEISYSEIKRGYNCPFCVGNASKTTEDYHALAEAKQIKWKGPEVSDTTVLTGWECEHGHRWQASYANLRRVKGCPECLDIVNGTIVSEPQKQLCDMVSGELNYPCDSYRIDIALPDKMVAIEYDCWYWHGNRQEEDRQRDADLIAAGWKVLHIKSNMNLPQQDELFDTIVLLQADGRNQAEIILDDWGKGPTHSEI